MSIMMSSFLEGGKAPSCLIVYGMYKFFQVGGVVAKDVFPISVDQLYPAIISVTIVGGKKNAVWLILNDNVLILA